MVGRSSYTKLYLYMYMDEWHDFQVVDLLTSKRCACHFLKILLNIYYNFIYTHDIWNINKNLCYRIVILWEFKSKQAIFLNVCTDIFDQIQHCNLINFLFIFLSHFLFLFDRNLRLYQWTILVLPYWQQWRDLQRNHLIIEIIWLKAS